MGYRITEDCVSCGACVSECPAEAIKDSNDRYVIDANTCTGCGTCAEVCPADAIVEG